MVRVISFMWHGESSPVVRDIGSLSYYGISLSYDGTGYLHSAVQDISHMIRGISVVGFGLSYPVVPGILSFGTGHPCCDRAHLSPVSYVLWCETSLSRGRGCLISHDKGYLSRTVRGNIYLLRYG